MAGNTPSMVWSIAFAALYIIQMYRMGRMSMHLRNPFAGRGLTLFSVLVYAPVLVIMLDDNAFPAFAGLIQWSRNWILYLLGGVVILGQVVIVSCRRKHIERLIDSLKNDQNPESRYADAVVLEQYRQHDHAIAAHRGTISIAPRFCKAYVNLAALLGIRRQFQEAEKLCRDAILIDPSYGPAHFYLGMALTEAGQKQAAKAEFQQALLLGIPGSLRMRADQMVHS